MLEWKVFNEEPLPEGPEETPRPPASRWFLRALLVVGVILAGLAISRLLRQQDTRLREDLTEVVLQEERALRVAAVEQAPDLSDPTAPPDWHLRYQDTFQKIGEAVPLPQVEQVEFQGNIALVTLTHETSEGKWQSARAYRLVQGQWRRTPVPARYWDAPKAYHSAHFTLWMSDRDAALIAPEELLRFLEQFYVQFSLLWPVELGERTLALQLDPRDLAPVMVPSPTEQQPLRLTSPLTTNYSYALSGPPARSYRYEVAAAVAEHLDLLASTEGYRNPDETALRVRLREALTRFILLSPEEQTLFRERVRQQQGGQQLPGGLLDTPTTVFLADYLVASEGPEALATLSRARLRSVDLPSAMVQGFGLSLDEVLIEVRLWMERSSVAGVPEGSEERSRATLLRLLNDDPFDAMLLLEENGQLIRLRATEAVRLSVPLRCLGLGSQLSFRRTGEPGPDVIGEAITLDNQRLPSMLARPLPTGTSLLISRQKNNRTNLLALDGQLGQEWPLLTLPPQTSIRVNPDQARFAFFHQDRCGLSINQHIPGESLITRVPLSLQGKGFLFYAGEQLYLLDDAPQGETLHWRVYPVGAWGLGEAIEYEIAGATGLDEVLGRLRDGRSYLLRLLNGEMMWLDLGRAELRRAEIEVPAGAEVKGISPNARWLAYTLPSEDGSTQLYAFDLREQLTYALYQSSAAATFGRVLWDPDGIPTLVTRLGIPMDNRIAGNTLLHVSFPADGSGTPDAQLIYLDGQIDQLHWCPDGSLFYRLTRDGAPIIARGLFTRPRELISDAEIVGCIGSPN